MIQKIGVDGFDYPEERNITSLPVTGYEFVRVRDLFNVLSFLRRKAFMPPGPTSLFNCLYNDLGWNSVPLLHFFNVISASSTPWIVTYEHYIPRWNVNSARGMRLLARKACRKIIAMSKFAFDFQCHYLEGHPEYRDAIRAKMCILHPAQKMLVNSYSEKEPDKDFITFTFAGTDFFRKGGKEILRVFDRLIAERYPVKLNIVSSMEYGDYASRTTEKDRKEALEVIHKLRDHVTLYHRLPNSEVLNLFRHSHVGLLPTYDDTYGFVVLESQAAGCPVISTDTCALPETNNDSIGWCIPVPKDGFGSALMGTAEQRSLLSSTIQEHLYSIVREICAHPGIVRDKGVRCLEKIKTECDPKDRAKTMEGIYREALEKA